MIAAFGQCGSAILRFLIFAAFQPLVTYRTLLRDSRWWQGLKINMGVAHYLRRYYQEHAPGSRTVSTNSGGRGGGVLIVSNTEEEDSDLFFAAATGSMAESYSGSFGTAGKLTDTFLDAGSSGGAVSSSLTPTKKRQREVQSIASPLQGLNVNLHSAQSLADTLDSIGQSGGTGIGGSRGVKLLNFAYIKLEGQSAHSNGRLLGQGSFSKVYRGSYKGQECAVKLIFTVDLTLDVIQRVAAESQILSSLNVSVCSVYAVFHFL